MRWLRAYEALASLKVSLPNTRLVCVGDRESDIYEFIAAARPAEADWLIRAVRDRITDDGHRLRERLADRPALGRLTIDVPKSAVRAAHQALLEVRVERLTLEPPWRPDRKLSPVMVTVMLVHEPTPPEGSEPIDWLLLSSLPQPSTLDEASVIISWYACRWQIEVFFRVLKGGCTVEQLQLQTRARLEAAIAIYLIVAWRVLFLVMLGRQCPDLPCTAIFDQDEWRTVFLVTQQKPPPAKPPTLQHLICLVAVLGGYTNRPSDSPPGPKTIWIGLQRARDLTQGMLLGRQLERLGQEDV